VSKPISRTARRALVIAPFLYVEMNANRPLSAACVLSEFAVVEAMTADFNHTTKAAKQNEQVPPIDRIIYLKTPHYSRNVSLGRLWSHLVFSYRAAKLLRKDWNRYDIVYVTLPMNIIAWYVLRNSSARFKIVDVMDIWPDALPFRPSVRYILAPLLAAWKWFFKASVRKAGLILAVSDEIRNSAQIYAGRNTQLKRLYIGHAPLVAPVGKQPTITIAYVGNLGWLYDFETLLDALSEKYYKDKVQVFVVGKGDRQNWLIRELERRSIRYHFFGVVFDMDRLAEILCSCHIGFNGYCNTTAAFSYKANTYFAAALPILNSMEGDLQRLVAERGLGLNYRARDVDSLKRCLAQINDHTLETMSTNCRKFFSDEIDRGRVRKDMHRYFAEYFQQTEETAYVNGERRLLRLAENPTRNDPKQALRTTGEL